MKDLTEMVSDYLRPVKALMIYRGKADEFYVESHDVDERGMAINAHPLSVAEGMELADALTSSAELKAEYLSGKGIFPENLLYANAEKNGFVLWWTPARKTNLFFHGDLGIKNGEAFVPPMVWKATRNNLSVWSIRENSRPSGETILCHAPFLNIYDDGSVCMGNVRIDIPSNCSTADFISLWERYFFNSTFSHAIGNVAWQGKELTMGWQSQIKSGKRFPNRLLKPTNRKLNDIIQ